MNVGGTGVVKFTAQLATLGAPAWLDAMVTTSTGNTSELTACFGEDTIFADGYQRPSI